MKETLTISPLMGQSTGKNISSVISRFGRRLMGFIRQRVSNPSDAEDIMQDVWYQLTATVDAEPIEQVGAWLFRVARNKIIDSYRKKRPESLDMLLSPRNEEEGPDLAGILLDDGNDPETANLQALFWKTLYEVLDELPQEQRDVFLWHEMDGLSFKEIAEITGEKVNTLISRKRYAILHLRERLLSLYQEIIEH
jgi:RNA polymerase sigma factor (sigma-70 family)